jgi:hypothetical protein
VLDELLAAGIVVVGTPMHNFTIPGQLKGAEQRQQALDAALQTVSALLSD